MPARRHFSTATASLALVMAFAPAAAAPGGASRDDAVAMVKRGLTHIRAQGAAQAYAAFTGRDSRFVDRDLYLVVYRLDGHCLAHGAIEQQVGRDLLELTDIDGKPFVRERVALVRSQPAGVWQRYKFINPVSRKIEQKVMYCERLDDTAVCGGVYP